ncbi:MAG: tRNA 2-thiouridine(34) synthase MnmA, partial [Nitrospirae bacterium]|nr:tRNA 2-thiouridine(34) synthase MnmA [Candidatus Troglogloeales bacterium]
MPEKKSVIVGMSGGVDSAVVAALLKEQGYNVIGVTLVLWKDEAEDEKRWQDRSCCKVGLARHVAKQLDIPHHTIDAQKAFKSEIIDDFCDTYLLGQTPNPCVRCNELIKFGGLLDIARKLGGDFLATGHYARINKKENGYTLQTGVDAKKDQSYFLYRLSQEQLAATLFPLGNMNKEAVYKKASALGLPYEDILESQEICFVNQKKYQTFIAENRQESVSPGEIVMAGSVVGEHKGVAFHTVGQRRGLNVALGERIYVTGIDPVKNQVTVGYADELLERELAAD